MPKNTQDSSFFCFLLCVRITMFFVTTVFINILNLLLNISNFHRICSVSKREKVKSLLMCICLTCIASTSRPTIARANTPCWNNRHITACITFTLLWCHQQEGAAFTVQWSGFCECICFQISKYRSANIYSLTLSVPHLY